MYRWLLAYIFFFPFLILSQTAVYFHLPLPEQKLPYSLYNSISFVDSRSDTNDLGRLYSNKVKRILPVSLKIDLLTQFNWLLYHLTDSTALDGELLVQLRKLKFVEASPATSDFSYCPIRIDLYAKKNNAYTKLGRLDTLILMQKKALTQKVKATTSLLFEETGRAIDNFILSHLYVQPVGRDTFSYEDVLNISTLEKQSMPLYSGAYVNGAYESFASFKKQTPDYKILDIKIKRGEVKHLYVISKNGVQQKKNAKTLYGFVYNFKLYLSGEFGFATLQKSDNDFYCYGKARTSADATSQLITRGILLPFIGYRGTSIYSSFAKDWAVGLYLMQLDHVDGSVIRLKEIK